MKLSKNEHKLNIIKKAIKKTRAEYCHLLAAKRQLAQFPNDKYLEQLNPQVTKVRAKYKHLKLVKKAILAKMGNKLAA